MKIARRQARQAIPRHGKDILTMFPFILGFSYCQRQFMLNDINLECFAMLNNSHLFIELSAKGKRKKTKVLFLFQWEINKNVVIDIVLQK